MFYRLARTRGSHEGAYCSREGLYLADAALIEQRGGRYLLRSEGEIALLVKAAYGSDRDCGEIAGPAW